MHDHGFEGYLCLKPSIPISRFMESCGNRHPIQNLSKRLHLLFQPKLFRFICRQNSSAIYAITLRLPLTVPIFCTWFRITCVIKFYVTNMLSIINHWNWWNRGPYRSCCRRRPIRHSRSVRREPLRFLFPLRTGCYFTVFGGSGGPATILPSRPF